MADGQSLWTMFIKGDGEGGIGGCLLGCVPMLGFVLLIGLIDLLIYFPIPTLLVLGSGLVWLIFIKRWE